MRLQFPENVAHVVRAALSWLLASSGHIPGPQEICQGCSVLRDEVIPTLVNSAGLPHCELTITLWRGWYQKSYPYSVLASVHVPFTCQQSSKKAGCTIACIGAHVNQITDVDL